MAKQLSIGIPAHQMPKEGRYREFIIPPPGYTFLAADVEQQETGLMADYSQDPRLLELWREGINIHAYTAEEISGMPYSDILAGKEAKEPKAVKLYKGGKVTDLGKNYRMGHKPWNDKKGIHHYATLYKNAHEKWELTPTEDEVFHWGDTWERTYKGVPKQWDKFIQIARTKGYAETLAGNTFHIHLWGGKWRWKSESSAIMHPIQGSGADMKYLAIAVVRYALPELIWFKEIHDEVMFLIPIDMDYMDMAARLKNCLDNLPYFESWGWKPTIKFTWSVSYGPNWGSLKELKL
jgi:DNA polymerase-1